LQFLLTNKYLGCWTNFVANRTITFINNNFLLIQFHYLDDRSHQASLPLCSKRNLQILTPNSWLSARFVAHRQIPFKNISPAFLLLYSILEAAQHCQTTPPPNIPPDSLPCHVLSPFALSIFLPINQIQHFSRFYRVRSKFTFVANHTNPTYI
jgi:hypothetical protein